MSSKNTNINWITIPRKDENEWCEFRKSFIVKKAVEQAIIRFESDCVCAVYLNGDFIISGTGRYPERVNCHEVTSRLIQGENTLDIVLGGHYFQAFARETKEKRGYWMNQTALELEICFTDGEKWSIPTNTGWRAINCPEDVAVLETMQVTKEEYETMWKNAALWQETKAFKPVIADKVLNVVGDTYKEYAYKKMEEVLLCENIVSTNMKLEDGGFYASGCMEEYYIIVDMGRLNVGYVEFEYKAVGPVMVSSIFDVSEKVEDFNLNNSVKDTVIRLATTDQLTTDKHFYRNLRRRAFRFMKLTFRGALQDFSVKSLRIRQCMFPETIKGWFQCSDEMLNRAWEIGKYTLHVNKQQEYESCPRCEMLFFAGDGAIDALIDIYTFGDCNMLNTSLSVKHEEKAIGISSTTKFNRTVWQWDYFAWRIICIYNYYQHTGDKAFLRRHYSEAVTNISWLIERMNDRDLLFQIPAFLSTFSSRLIQVDWACSQHRLGENAFLNCLLFRSLECMAELANDMDDKQRGKEWNALANRVKLAINKHLWDDNKKAYVDGISDYICQDANALAVLFGIADKDRSLSALATVKKELWSAYGSAMANVKFDNHVLRGGNTTISPMMSTREAEAWFMHDKAEEALELIRRVWGSMLRKGATTFWEFNPNNADQSWSHKCHAWSAGCTYLLSAYILGIRPVSRKWETVLFAPKPCNLSWGKGVVPTPHGLIAASWEMCKEGVCKYKIVIPEKIKLSTDVSNSSVVEVITY